MLPYYQNLPPGVWVKKVLREMAPGNLKVTFS
jgi:hypothetical protein